MDPAIIDLIYQNEAVEGIAIFDAQNQLVENQLSINQGSVLVIAETIHNIRMGLASAGRDMLGFLIKTDRMMIQVCMFPDKLVLLEVSQDFSANETDKKLRSIFGGSRGATTQLVSVKSVQLPAAAEEEPVVEEIPVAQAVTEVIPEPQIVDGIDWQGFKGSTHSLLKRVAPDRVAENMMNGVIKDMGLDPAAELMPKEQAVEFGYKVIAKIPNKSRRALMEKEYTSLLSSII
ncbi:hypothetical protein OAB00_00760 [Akkermansiaceae bacterium]|nr:hypothetical protein [Akkermansiaceae bacterium]